MKNKILSILIVFFALSVCLFTLTACRDKDMCTNGSVHAYGQWVSNGDGTHTRVCAYDFSHTETLKCGGGIATCTEKAVCAICLQPYGEIKEHNIVIDELVEPTCSQTGLTLGCHCEDCGEIFIEQEVIKTDTERTTYLDGDIYILGDSVGILNNNNLTFFQSGME